MTSNKVPRTGGGYQPTATNHQQPPPPSSKYPYQNHSELTLWMGDIDSAMDERFIKTSFALVGFNAVSVRVVKDRGTGLPVGYGFVTFENEEVAQEVLRTMNGVEIPNTKNGKKFKLNHTNSKEHPPQQSEYSLFVGDLSPEVDDYTLRGVFGANYESTCSARVMHDRETGESRGFGFVRFSKENDYLHALNNAKSLTIGSTPIYVREANPPKSRRFNKPHFGKRFNAVGSQPIESPTPENVGVNQTELAVYPSENVQYLTTNLPYTVPNHYYYHQYPYWFNPYVNQVEPGYIYGPQQLVPPTYVMTENNMFYPSPYPSHGLVDHGHSQTLDAEKLNEEMIAKNEDLYTSFENSRWSSVDCDTEKIVQ